MILRKPYAFLIKNFRKINILLFLLSIYVLVRNFALITFTSDYSSSGSYLSTSPISNYIDKWFLLSIGLIIVFSIILITLLKFKDKPIKTYVFMIISYAIVFGISLYTLNYFGQVPYNDFNRSSALIVRDLVFIMSLPQYIVIILLLIRSLGLDLKSFGFSQDKEFLVTEADREEVEVEANIDKDKYKRKLNKILRKAGYVWGQYKLYITIGLVTFFVITIGLLLKNYFIDNRIYSMNQTVTSNYYKFKVNNAYITNKDYKGDVIKENRQFVILDVNVTNQINSTRNLDIEKFILYVGDKYYVPTKSYNNYFIDMGNVFQSQSLAGKASDNYLLIFEIENPKDNDNFILKYQDLKTKTRLIRIKLKIRDISEYITKDNKMINEEMTIPINSEETEVIKVTSYSLNDYVNYTYEECYINDCPIKTGVVTASENKKILYMRTSNQILDFIKKYGKIRYTVDGVTYQESVKSKLTKYRGNHLYLEVDKKIELSSSIEIVFTVRSYQYFYKLK